MVYKIIKYKGGEKMIGHVSGIYLITNDINNKVYVGQSGDCLKRWKGHLYESKHLDARNATGVDYAIAKYGEEFFNIELLEEIADEKILDDREKYWISYYDSYNNGYNRTIGGKSLRGEDHPRAKISEADVIDIRDMYAAHCKLEEVLKKYANYEIQERGLRKIWKGETWTTTHMDVYTPENKEWHRTKGVGHSEDQLGLSPDDRKLTQEEINKIYADYQNGFSITDLVHKYKRDYGVIQKYINHPVAVQKVPLKGRKIRNIETGKEFNSISAAARWAGCGATTITRHLYDNKPAGKIPEINTPAHWEEIS